MNRVHRVVTMMNDDELAALEAAVVACGCGSMSAHVRHILKAQ